MVYVKSPSVLYFFWSLTLKYIYLHDFMVCLILSKKYKRLYKKYLNLKIGTCIEVNISLYKKSPKSYT